MLDPGGILVKYISSLHWLYVEINAVRLVGLFHGHFIGKSFYRGVLWV